MRKKEKPTSYLLRIGWGKKAFSNRDYKKILIENLIEWSQERTSIQFIIGLAENIYIQNGVENDTELAWILKQILTIGKKGNQENKEEITDNLNNLLQKITHHIQQISFPEIA